MAVALVALDASADEPDRPVVESPNIEPDAESDAPPEPLSVTQRRIADRFRRLEQVLVRMSELTEASDPRRAALLRKAVKQSGERLLEVQFDTLVELLDKDQLSRAMENQENLGKDLKALLELLRSEDRAKRIEAEKTRIRNYIKRLNVIIKREKDLQGRTEGGGNPKEISSEQGRVADTTKGLAEDIRENEEGDDSTTPDESDPKQQAPEEEPAEEEPSQEKPSEGKPQEGKPQEGKPQEGKPQEGKPQEGKPQEGKPQEGKPQDGKPQEGKPQEEKPQEKPSEDENPARKRLEAARQRMEEAQEKLENAEREGAVEKQEEAIRELEQAKAELEEILRQLREEEIVRMLAMLEARFQKMLLMQREVYEGTLRLDAVPEARRSRSHEIEAGRLSGKETDIVIECDKALLVLHEDGTAVAFPEAVGQMRDDMQQIVLRLAETKVGNITQAIEEDVIAALEEMVEALKKAQEEMEEKQEEEQEEQPPGEQQEPPLIDMLAELRMIRALQMRINRRTERYSELIDGEQASQPDLLDALRRLAERQSRIHQVMRDLEMGRNK